MQKIGRFEIRGELGRGAQSVVYRAWDPQLEREVAIKTLHFQQPNPGQNRALLAEARSVSRLRHANLVPIFEAGEEEGDLYLVFEYVPGRNLAEFLRIHGALQPVRAAGIMRDILVAVAQAHAAGVIHRDLKPSNILLDADDTPRVMDFGIATPVDAPSERMDQLSGTPNYMAPEYVLRRELSERSDVFAAGLILYEMLSGRRAFSGGDLQGLLQRVASETVRLPAEIPVDERLAAITHKALAVDPALRYQSAEQFAAALDDYLEPPLEAPSGEVNAQATVEFLLRRMRHKSDFPALSESVTAINRIANSETESVNRLSSTILRDFALTNKILRLVNSVHFRTAGGGNISTVSRAVIVLGFEAVRNIAITVLLFEHLQNKGNAGQLKEAFLRTNLAAVLARDLSQLTRLADPEQAFICALFHGLGRLLALYYFPEESDEIRRQMLQKNCSEETAARSVLGIGLQDLGVAIARQWGFPQLIVDSMRDLPAGRVRHPASAEERLRVLSGMAEQLCDMLGDATPETRVREMKKIQMRFATALPVADEELNQSLHRSIAEVGEFARIIQLNVKQTAFGRQIQNFVSDNAPDGEDAGTASTFSGTVLHEGEGVLADAPTLSEQPDAQAVLTAGIQDISNSLVDDFKLNDILRIILETMYRAMGFKRVLLCIRDARSNSMQGRFGLGPDSVALSRSFRFSLEHGNDVFFAACARGADILISDTDDPKIAARIPEWYHKLTPARSFILLPLTIKGKPVALIYADADAANSIIIPEKELSLLRTLRNQAVLAIKQGG